MFKKIEKKERGARVKEGSVTARLEKGAARLVLGQWALSILGISEPSKVCIEVDSTAKLVRLRKCDDDSGHRLSVTKQLQGRLSVTGIIDIAKTGELPAWADPAGGLVVDYGKPRPVKRGRRKKS